MESERPDPEELLAEIQAAAAREQRGRLKIFFGASAGVGKTFAMLAAAQALRRAGTDVVVGLLETHGRAETATMLEGLEQLPPLLLDVQGAKVKEFDLDAALERRPTLILVDELAHTNAPGARHPKRWQDVDELLGTGINVYSSLNVQHIESLNDVIGQITGIRVKETLPDTFFETADEVELIDLAPDELLKRLREGKVYIPQQIERALDNFFKKGNLIALREMALRQTAHRVDAQMREYREEKAIAPIWAAGEHILVAVGPDGRGERLVRSGKRLAEALDAEWHAVYVETPTLLRLPQAERDRILGYLRLAEQLGAKTAVLSGASMADELLGYARESNTSKLIMGKPRRRGIDRWLRGSVVDAVTDGLRGIELQLVGDAEGEPRGATAAFADQLSRTRSYFGIDETKAASRKRRLPRYVMAVAICGVATVLASLLFGRFEATNLVMVYLVGVLSVAYRFGRGPAIVASLLSVALFDFLFVPPYYSFAVSDTQYLLTFAVMLAVGLVISNLMASIRLQARVAQHRQGRTEALYKMTRELSRATGQDEVVTIAVQHVAQVFEAQAVVLLPGRAGTIGYPRAQGIYGSYRGAELGTARWVFANRVAAGLGTHTLAGAEGLYLPLLAAHKLVGVMAALPARRESLLVPEQRHLLETFAGQIAVAIERVQLAAEAATFARRAETESLRNSLLNAISHDLRTPLAVLVGASSSLVDQAGRLSDAARRELAVTIHEESKRMSTLVGNLLDMARLESGAVELARQWTPLEEIVGSVLARLKEVLVAHPVRVSLPRDLPLVSVDPVLLEQVFANLLENAAKYTPAGTPVEISAQSIPGRIVVEVADAGPGIPPGEESKLFDKFYRLTREPAQSGVGLGLAICKAIIAAHGGTIAASNRATGGAIFRFELPAGEPPAVEAEPEPVAPIQAAS
ncbi:MAG: sensor histidine kinase KdpD [Betaproteobacteria bacterium]|nr:MAG: sensor histidine kinase KdpD [Betaproteobacteria bacterium]